MDTSTHSIQLTSLLPAVRETGTGIEHGWHSQLPRSAIPDLPSDGCASVQPSLAEQRILVRRLRSLVNEMCAAIRCTLDDERSTAEDCLRRAAEILKEVGATGRPAKEEVSGRLAPWQLRKVTAYIEAHMDRTIRNEDLAAVARLNPSHFGRIFQNSVGETPHEYVIRRRVERAQGLMLSTGASLSDIALDCGLEDQAHLTRLFRRTVGESPRAWRRARLDARE